MKMNCFESSSILVFIDVLQVLIIIEVIKILLPIDKKGIFFRYNNHAYKKNYTVNAKVRITGCHSFFIKFLFIYFPNACYNFL